MDAENNGTDPRINAPIVVYIVHHPDCDEAKWLATRLFRWFRLGDYAGDAAAAGLPVYYRRKLDGNSLQPDICWDEAELNVVIVLVDYRMVLDPSWRVAIVELAENVRKQRENGKQNGSLLLPVALHESFYQIQGDKKDLYHSNAGKSMGWSMSSSNCCFSRKPLFLSAISSSSRACLRAVFITVESFGFDSSR